ncbi:MAG: hypothetical protein K0R65_2290 [Crocinitomicaceae bacterium]|nr:hypothetical protein [Crocinitomicaceae bacterium]
MGSFYPKATIAAVILLLGITSCKKFEDLKIAKTAWNPNLAVPIGSADFGVYDILASQDSNDLIIIDPVSGEIALSYSSEIASFDAASIVEIGNFSQNYSITLADLSIPVSAAYNGNANAFKNDVLPLTMQNGEEINTILFDSGILNVHIETELKHNLNITVTFPDFIVNSAPVTENLSMNYAGTVPQEADFQVDLNEVLGDFTNNGTTVNETRVQIQLSVMGTGEEVTGTENFSVELSSSNLDFHHITGYIGQQNIVQEADSVLLRIFQNSVDGTFELTNPKVVFTIDNSFGVPIALNLSELKTINVATGVETDLLNYPTTIDVEAPTVMGQTETTELELNNSNTTNLSSVISPTPKYFYYEINGQANPDGQTATPNFVMKESRCTIKTEVDMPLEGYAYGFSITDTVEFTQFENQNADLIEFVMFRLIVDNGFPVLLGTQITAIDENGNHLFSIFNQPENIIEPAPVDATGRVTEQRRKINDITLTAEQIAMLADVEKLIIYGEASTTDADMNKVVKFYDDYKINLKLALQIQAQTQF